MNELCLCMADGITIGRLAISVAYSRVQAETKRVDFALHRQGVHHTVGLKKARHTLSS